MQALLIGSVSSTVAALRGFLRGGFPVAGVCGLSREYAAGVSDYHDLGPLARDANIPFVGFRKVTEPQVTTFIRQVKPAWLFVIGLSQLLPPELRALATHGAIGFHPTMLPEGRGRVPVAWTILLNRPAAANLFFLTDEADAGDIIDQQPVPVLPDDYAAELIARTNDVLEQMIVDLAPAFVSGRVPRRPQDHARATCYERRRPEDGRIDWNQPAESIYRLICAVSHPYPGAFSYYQKMKVIVWRASLAPGGGSTESGTVVAIENGLPVIQTGNGRLQVTDMEWAGDGAREWSVGMMLETTERQ